VLILLSDGVEVGDALRRNGTAPDAPPGELAEKLLEWSQNQQDDATAVVIRLHRNGSRLY
jgi:serine/threonine protein phosphatase PrpC